MKLDTLKHQKTEIVARRGFKSHPVRLLSDRDLQSKRNTNVTNQGPTEAEKAREVMLLVRGLADQKTAWMWGSQ
jgi:hypothetical protein